MIISCNNCNKNFEINSNLIPIKGRLLQCSACDHRWFFKDKAPINAVKNDNSNIPTSFGKVNGPFPGYFNGEIDNVQIWNTALLQQEIINCEKEIEVISSTGEKVIVIEGEHAQDNPAYLGEETAKRYIEQSCKPNVWFIASLKLVAYTVLQYVTIVVAPLND